MRVRALYMPFTAKCSRPVGPTVDQQDETTRAATTSHRMLARTSISLDIARRIRLYLAAPRRAAPCAFRACLPAANCFIHACACDVTHYTTRSRSEAFSSLPESSRWMRDWPSYLYSRPASTPFSRGYCTTFVAPQAKRRFYVPAFHFQ